MLLWLLEQDLMRLFPGLFKKFTEDLITKGQEERQAFFFYIFLVF